MLTQIFSALILGMTSAHAEGAGPVAVNDCADCPSMVLVPAGSFRMGAPESESQNRKFGWGGPEIDVKIARPFYMAKTETTVAQWAAFVRASGYKQDGRCRSIWEKRLMDPTVVRWEDPIWPDGSKQSAAHPVVCVGFEDAVAYADWLTAQSGGKRVYSLPSEAEHEYATRAGTTGARPWPGPAADTCKYANVGDRAYNTVIPEYPGIDCDDRFAFTSPVGSFPENAFGLHDLLGNAWEWVLDCRAEDLNATPRDGRALVGPPADCKRRVMRGAGFTSGDWYVRVTTRGGDPVPGTRLVVLGFRVAARPIP